MKKFIEPENKENYKEIVYHRAIIICWILLVIFLILKIFGSNVANIVCNNQVVINICVFIDNNLIFKILLGTISSFISYTLLYLAILRKRNFTKVEWIVMCVTIPIFVTLRLLFSQVSYIFDIIQYFIMPFIFSRGKKVKCIEWFIPVMIYGNVLNFLFQLISLFAKNVALQNVESTLIGVILMIDVFIMLGLYYLYSNNYKGEKNMGWFLNWLFSKSESQLNKMKESRLRKINALQEEIAEIDEVIKEKQNDSKKED